MGELVFVGLGLHDHLGMSLRGLQETKKADNVFIELYTSLLPSFSIEQFAELSGKKPQTVLRRDLEEMNGKIILDAARSGKTVLLVPGDPLIATTHVALRIEAEKLGIRTRIVHGASIASAAMGLSGLHSYKFGKTVTLPFPDETPSTTPYEVIAENKRSSLHTLCLLDIKTEEGRYMTINDGLQELLRIGLKKKDKDVDESTIAVGVARAGSEDPDVKGGFVKELLHHDFGTPPHCMIFPGGLHFMEAEALIALTGAPEVIRRLAQ